MKARGNVKIISYSTKYERPVADISIDVSFLKNPARQKEWCPFSAVNVEMRSWMMQQRGFSELIDALTSIILSMIKYDDVTCAIGCNGGRHRSPIVSNALADRLSVDFISVTVEHTRI